MTEIRSFQEEDLSALSQIYLEGRIETFPWVPRDQFKREDFSKDTEGEKILVAVHSGQPVGFISIWTADHFIHNLFVRKDAQALGIGDRLLTEGLKIISKPARLKCVVRNTKACAFYEKRGWKKESSGEDSITGPYHTYVCE